MIFIKAKDTRDLGYQLSGMFSGGLEKAKKLSSGKATKGRAHGETIMKEAMQNAFHPTISIKVQSVDMDLKLPIGILKEIHALFKYKRETMLDTKQGVIYIGKEL